MSQVIAVFGSTGMQGGGVVAALLKSKKFQVRAVTRNAQSDKAKALKNQGKLSCVVRQNYYRLYKGLK